MGGICRYRWLAAFVLLGALCGIPQTTGAQPKEAEENPDPMAAQLEAVGGLSAVNAQHTFLLIGVTSDAFVKEVYDAKQVRSIMKGIIRQLDAVSGMLRKLQDAGLSAEDDDYVDRIVDTYRLLQDQARALNKYVDKKGDTEAKAFEKSRQAALKSLNTLLGTSAETTEEKPVEEPAKEEEEAKKPTED